MSNAMSRDLIRLVHAAERAQRDAADKQDGEGLSARGASAGDGYPGDDRACAGGGRFSENDGHGRFGQRIHLMPPTGWLNDPNGLCQKDGVFHAYFQYAPFDVLGGVKMWGHCTSRDLLQWEYQGVPLLPDQPFDVHGVYSGSALVEDGKIRVLYTGSVKKCDPDGVYDYVNAGRESNTVLVESEDGETFSEKRLVLTNADYPSDLTCHVRDPKVWRTADGAYRLVLGARRRVDAPYRETPLTRMHGCGAGTDRGEILVYASLDMRSWSLANRLSTPERFGFMWECPDFFALPVSGAATGGVEDGRLPVAPSAAGAPRLSAQFLCCSPQGAEGPDWERRNIYAAGYFPFTGDIDGEYELGEFQIWDGGFDFYAPQTFEAEDGRRILIAWMGMPDAPDYDNEPTVRVGWQHCMTIPREVTAGEDGLLRQAPAREIELARGAQIESSGEFSLDGEGARCFDLTVEATDAGGLDKLAITLAHGLSLAWLAPDAEGPARLELRFHDADRSSMGCGRNVRWEPVRELRRLRIIGDASSIEVFVNEGELTMSTRYYPDSYSVRVDSPGARISFWPLVLAA